MKVKIEIEPVSINGKDTVINDERSLVVTNVCNRSKLVRLTFSDGLEMVVFGNQLIQAIQNSTNIIDG